MKYLKVPRTRFSYSSASGRWHTARFSNSSTKSFHAIQKRPSSSFSGSSSTSKAFSSALVNAVNPRREHILPSHVSPVHLRFILPGLTLAAFLLAFIHSSLQSPVHSPSPQGFRSCTSWWPWISMKFSTEYAWPAIRPLSSPSLP